MFERVLLRWQLIAAPNAAIRCYAIVSENLPVFLVSLRFARARVVFRVSALAALVQPGGRGRGFKDHRFGHGNYDCIGLL
jgi:hypothetical protein